MAAHDQHEHIVIGTDCPELARLIAYADEAYRRYRKRPWAAHQLADLAHISKVIVPAAGGHRVLVIAHGTRDGLVSRGTPQPGDCEYLHPGWWHPLRHKAISLYLLGCYTAHVGALYNLRSVAGGTVAYRDLVAFYDGNALGRELSKMVIGGLVRAWLAHGDAQELLNLVRQTYEEVLERTRRHRGFFPHSREVVRLMRILIGLQLEGVERA